MTFLSLALALGVDWSVTGLLIRDRLLGDQRAALRSWLRRRRHHRVNAHAGAYRCSCGFTVTTMGDVPMVAPTLRQLANASVSDFLIQPGDTVESLWREHLRNERAMDAGKAVKLTECPWCASVYVGALVALGAFLVADWTWWQAVAFPLAARCVVAALIVRVGPDDETPDEPERRDELPPGEALAHDMIDDLNRGPA